MFESLAKVAAGVAEDLGFQIDNSIWLDGVEDSLERTLATAEDRQKGTFFIAVKRANLTALQVILEGAVTADTYIRFTAADELEMAFTGGDRIRSDALLRDVGAPYLLTIAWDTTQPIAADRVKFYRDFDQLDLVTSAGSGFPDQNQLLALGNTGLHKIGKLGSDVQWLDAYISHCILVFGTQHTPSSFLEVDINGVPRITDPLATSLDFGVEGSWLEFKDADLTGAPGTAVDSSGNGNDWDTISILQLQQTTDTPTNNIVVWNLLDLGSTTTLTEGNRKCLQTFDDSTYGTFGVREGKWYLEWIVDQTLTGNANGGFGLYVIDSNTLDTELHPLQTLDQTWIYNPRNGNFSDFEDPNLNPYGIALINGDILGLRIDLDAGTLEYFVNDVSQGDPGATNLAGKVVTPIMGYAQGSGGNFGATLVTDESDLNFALPADHKTFNTTNLPAPPIPDGSEQFQAHVYAGTGVAHDETYARPLDSDLLWIKNLSNIFSHNVVDAVRGATLQWHTDNTDAETADAAGVTDLDVVNGFGLGTGVNGYNNSGDNLVAWSWKVGGAGAVNNDGSIAATVSANQLAGISLIKYTGTGAIASVGHGLTQRPDFVIVRALGGAFFTHWYQDAVSPTWIRFQKLTVAEGSESDTNTMNGLPDSLVVNLGDNTLNGGTNRSGDDHIMIAAHSVPGFSKVGSYIGNGDVDGPFIYCGFTPEFIIIKYDFVGEDWQNTTAALSPFNVSDDIVYANLDSIEQVGNPAFAIDRTANGFKIRTDHPGKNFDGGSYIFYAAGRYPLGGIGISPANAI